jgi:putative DNA primase/helicase
LSDETENSGGAAAMTPEQMRAAVEKRIADEAAELAAAGKGPAGGNGHREIDYKFLKRCLQSNELGDGILYSAVHQDTFIFNASSQQWMRWMGQHWEIDVEERCLGAVEDVATKYLTMLDVIAGLLQKHSADKERVKRLERLQAKVLKRVTRLRSERGRKNCLKLAASNKDAAMVTRGDSFDLNPWLLPCHNAVINLRTGEGVKANPSDMLLKACPTEWRGIDSPCPTWERFMIDVFESNMLLIEYVQRLLGYALTGLIHEHVLPILIGIGRNGKGVLADTIMFVVGDLVQPVPVELLLDQGRSRSSAAPSPDIMALKGVRIAFASEPDENRRFSMGRVKWLTGGDPLTGRWPNDKFPVTFLPTHKLLMLTNDLPHASSDDFAFWERVNVIPFNLSFVSRDPAQDFERRADLGLRDQLKGEASGILAWLVRGCLEWQRAGLNPPSIVKESTSEYKADEDILQDWIDECCTLDPYAETVASQLYDNFADWHFRRVNSNRKRVPSQHWFGRRLKKRFKRKKSGQYIYYGITCAVIDQSDGQERFNGYQ